MTTVSKKAYKVGISGSYGGLNLGDEAILQCVITQLRESLPVEITVFSRDPADTLKFHKVERAIPVRVFSRGEILPEIERLDLFILGGGGILFDGEVQIYMREVSLALEKGVPVMTYAIGAGPLHNPENQRLVRENLDKAEFITVRERSAKKVLEEAGVSKEIIITADPALLLKPEALPPEALHREGLVGKQRFIGMSVREPGMAAPDINENTYHTLIANTADFLVERYNANIVFVPMERKYLDLQHSHAIMAQMLRADRATVLKGSYSAGQMLSLMRHFYFAVGMRLHFLIFAALQGVPFVALPYASKVTGFLEDLQIEAPPLSLVNAGRIIAHIDNSCDERAAIATRIKQTLPELQQRARKTNEIAVELLKRRQPKKNNARQREKAHAPA
ncbi:MAG: polysaccharide pyruvyl transferase family protein [Endomicrobiales bacterium]